MKFLTFIFLSLWTKLERGNGNLSSHLLGSFGGLSSVWTHRKEEWIRLWVKWATKVYGKRNRRKVGRERQSSLESKNSNGLETHRVLHVQTPHHPLRGERDWLWGDGLQVRRKVWKTREVGLFLGKKSRLQRGRLCGDYDGGTRDSPKVAGKMERTLVKKT